MTHVRIYTDLQTATAAGTVQTDITVVVIPGEATIDIAVVTILDGIMTEQAAVLRTENDATAITMTTDINRPVTTETVIGMTGTHTTGVTTRTAIKVDEVVVVVMVAVTTKVVHHGNPQSHYPKKYGA